MKRIVLILTALVPLSFSAIAQYIPTSNQAFQFASTYNPAFSGVEPYGDLKLGYRYQWAGFGDDAPRFINLAVNMRLKQPADLTHHALRTSIPADAIEIPKRKRIIHALGVNLFREEVTAIDRQGGGLSYAFHYPLSTSGHLKLATGVAVLLENIRVNADELYLGRDADPDPYFENLISSGVNRTNMNVRAGILLYSPAFYVGVSYLPSLNIDVNGGDVENNFDEQYYRGTAQAGVSLPINSSLELKPSVMGILRADDQVQVDYNLKLFIQQRVLIGASYRSIDSVVGLIGINLNKLLMASYSYEVSTGAFKKFNDGSHELVVSFRFNNSKNLNPYIW